MEDACAEDAASGGLRCMKCEATLVVDRVTGLCGCPAGKYAVAGTLTCLDCAKGFYCLGGPITPDRTPAAISCGPGMTTIGLRSFSPSGCVNLPGFSFMVDALGLPAVSACPVNTYNQGMRRQRTCWPCPAGYTTNGMTGRTDISACVVPPGSYMQYPTIVSLCPRGQWKSTVGPDETCNSCPSGVTTANLGSTSAANCTVLLPGYYAATMSSGAITEARPCPQKYFCPGGQPLQAGNPPAVNAQDTTLQLCPNGLWTRAPGASAALDCLTPPGFFTASGATTKCAAGSFRAGWTIAASASSCTSCGTGVFAVEDDAVQSYSLTYSGGVYTSTNIGVTTVSTSCYIKPGQGLYYVSTGNTWRARNCVSGNWGVNETTSGLATRNCRGCPLNMVTSTNRTAYPRSASYYVDNGDGRTGGFISKWACVNQPGYGFNNRWSFPCPLGTYNAGDNWSNCTECGYGLTTAAPGAGIMAASCGIAPGYGFQSSAVVLCPQGYYNDRAIDYTKSQPCLQCPTGTTTVGEGSTSASDCNLCLAGYGETSCATQCGGFGDTGNYGPGLRPLSTPCTDCPTTNLTVGIGGTNQTLVAAASARPGADSAGDCLSLWASYGTGWYLPATPGSAYLEQTAVDLSACLALCTGECQFATYNPTTQACSLRQRQSSPFVGAPVIGFKTLAAGNASSPAGRYVHYQDANALEVGTGVAPAGVSGFNDVQQCRDACDQDAACAAFSMKMVLVEADMPKTCLLVYGVDDPAQSTRSFVRADATRLALPVLI